MSMGWNHRGKNVVCEATKPSSNVKCFVCLLASFSLFFLLMPQSTQKFPENLTSRRINAIFAVATCLPGYQTIFTLRPTQKRNVTLEFVYTDSHNYSNKSVLKENCFKKWHYNATHYTLQRNYFSSKLTDKNIRKKGQFCFSISPRIGRSHLNFIRTLVGRAFLVGRKIIKLYFSLKSLRKRGKFSYALQRLQLLASLALIFYLNARHFKHTLCPLQQT